jgi:hypothetical protein
MIAVVDRALEPAVVEGAATPAGVPRGFMDDDLPTRLDRRDRGGKPRHPGADDVHPGHRIEPGSALGSKGVGKAVWPRAALAMQRRRDYAKARAPQQSPARARREARRTLI